MKRPQAFPKGRAVVSEISNDVCRERFITVPQNMRILWMYRRGGNLPPVVKKDKVFFHEKGAVAQVVGRFGE